MSFRKAGHADSEPARIWMCARFVESPNELHQVDRVLKRILRFVVRNVMRPIAPERENVPNGRLTVSNENVGESSRMMSAICMIRPLIFVRSATCGQLMTKHIFDHVRVPAPHFPMVESQRRGPEIQSHLLVLENSRPPALRIRALDRGLSATRSGSGSWSECKFRANSRPWLWRFLDPYPWSRARML